MKATITITVDTDSLQSYTDTYLAQLWHVAQANPMDGFANSEPGELAERIGREIIRRFLTNTAPDLWHHQGTHHPFHMHLNAQEKQAAETLERFATWADAQPADVCYGIRVSHIARQFAKTLKPEGASDANA